MSLWWCLLCTRPTRWVGFFIVLAQWNNSPRIDMSPHSDTLSWLRVNQSLLFLLNAACLAEKQHIPILVFGLTRSGAWTHDLLHSRWAPYHYTTYAVPMVCLICNSMCALNLLQMNVSGYLCSESYVFIWCKT